MSRPVSTGCRCMINGQEITPEWLVENKGIRHPTAVHRIYEYNRGLIPVETLMTYGMAYRNKGVAKASDEWKRLSDTPKPCDEFRAGEWERKNIPDRGEVGKCKAGRPQGTPAAREGVAYYQGQFAVNL